MRNLGVVLAALVVIASALLVFGATRHPKFPWPGRSVPTTEACLELPPGKGKSLYELLAPRDIRVIVSAHDRGVCVQGTAHEIDALANLTELITRFGDLPKSEAVASVTRLRPRWTNGRTYKLSRSKSDALFAVLAPDDVAVLVSRAGRRGIHVQSTPADQEIVRRVVEILRGNRRP